MRVHVIFGSNSLDVRIIGCIASAKGAEFVGYSRDLQDVIVPAGAEDPQVVIIDAQQSETLAIEALKKVRDLQGDRIKIVVHSSSEADYVEQLILAGANYCIHAPDEFDQLIRLISGD